MELKVKTLLKELEEAQKKYPDFLEWEVYTEQPYLMAPQEHRTIEEEKAEMKRYASCFGLKYNRDYIKDLKESKKQMDELEKNGWKFVINSEGWVFRSTAAFGKRINDEFIEDGGTVGIFEDKKIFTINNNY